jgi:hypothetical protein
MDLDEECPEDLALSLINGGMKGCKSALQASEKAILLKPFLPLNRDLSYSQQKGAQ